MSRSKPNTATVRNVDDIFGKNIQNINKHKID